MQSEARADQPPPELPPTAPPASEGRGRGDRAWEALGSFLGRDLLLLGPEERRAPRREWEAVSELERNLDDRLAIGIIGGTGVGKSTLINALAGDRISLTGPRRPTTDRVVVYRHEATPLPATFPRDHLALPEVEHRHAALERLILLDFPDFDSVEELHHRILSACLPHLDLLLLVVDDMKYADDTLFRLLGRLPQNTQNLHVILNKTDRLERRYGAGLGEVVAGILEDLAGKLERHVGIVVGRDRLFAISADAAFRVGSGAAVAPAVPAASPPASPGEFDRLVSLLEGYRQEKRRRAAKELNVESRKASLRDALRARTLDEDRLRRAERIRAHLGARRDELDGVLAAIPVRILGPHERRWLASETLRYGTRGFGFPIDLLLAILRQVRPARALAPPAGPIDLSPSRVRAHYQGWLDAVQNSVREFRLELGDVLPPERLDPSSEVIGADGVILSGAIAGSGDGLQVRIRAARESIDRRSRLWNHAPALAVVAGFAWWVVYPTIRSAAEGLLGEGGVSWTTILRKLVLAVVDVLNPFLLLGLGLAVALSYAGAALWVWTRQGQRIEGAVLAEEELVRDRLRGRGASALELLERGIDRWRAERRELEDLL